MVCFNVHVVIVHKEKTMTYTMTCLTLPSNLEYSLNGLLSCCGHCSSRSESMDLLPVFRGRSLKSFFSNSELKSSARARQYSEHEE